MLNKLCGTNNNKFLLRNLKIVSQLLNLHWKLLVLDLWKLVESGGVIQLSNSMTRSLSNASLVTEIK